MPFRLMSMISYRWTNMRHNDQNQGPSVRVLRVGEQVRHVLSEILQRGDVHDDVLATHPVSVTEVRMSPDLRHATVFVKSLLGRDEEAVLKALRTNTAYQIGRAHVRTPVTNAHLVCRLLLEKKKK